MMRCTHQPERPDASLTWHLSVRALEQQRFEQALRRLPGDSRNVADAARPVGEDDDRRGRDDSTSDPGIESAFEAHPELFAALRRSLLRHPGTDVRPGLAGADVAAPPSLESLCDDIADALHSARRRACDHWRLVYRLRDDCMPRTEVHIACRPGHFAVVFRTSSALSRHRLAAALPRLDAALARLGVEALPVRCVLVDIEELS